MKVAVGRAMFSFLQKRGKDLDRSGEEKSLANLKKPPLSNGPDTTSFISALADAALSFMRTKKRISYYWFYQKQSAVVHPAFLEDSCPTPGVN